MPPTFLLWTLAACGSKNGDSSGAPRHHPVGYYDFNVHGPDAKLQTEVCVDCHGDDLEGGTSGVACSSCHPANWKTDCLFCHGGTDNKTGAPPRDILGATGHDELTFPPHSAHVETTSTHAAYDCTTCHVKPTDCLSPGHVLVGDTTSGKAEVAVAGGLNPNGTYDGLTCGNLYCHGNGQDDGAVAKTDTITGCDGCHADWESGSSAWATMSGHHQRHMLEGFDCSDCHADTVDANHAIVGTDLHVDGTAEVVFTGGITWTDGKCTGTCHGEAHSNRTW